MYTKEIKPKYLEKMVVIREKTGKSISGQVDEAIEQYLHKNKAVL